MCLTYISKYCYTIRSMTLKKSIVQGFVMGLRNIVADAFKYACLSMPVAGCLYVESMKADYQLSNLKI